METEDQSVWNLTRDQTPRRSFGGYISGATWLLLNSHWKPKLTAARLWEQAADAHIGGNLNVFTSEAFLGYE